MSAPKKQDLINEIATTRDGRDITRGFVDALPLLPSTDRLLALKGGGDLLIYQEVMRDEQVKACFGQRVRAVIARPWEVRPGGDKRLDKQAAQFIEEQLKSVNFDAITEKMLAGVFYGYAVAEPMYAVEGGKIVLDTTRGGIKVRDRRRFGFAPDMSLRLKTMSAPLGEELPEKKFWHFATGSDHDDEPYGLGLAHWLYWPVFFKRSGVKFWLIFLEKFGSPTAMGTYQPGTSKEDQDKLLASLQAVQTDSAIIFPDGMTAELLEATRGGTADYTSLFDRMDAAIARVTLGQTASTQGTPGKLGNDELQGDVRADIVKADADLICMSLNATVIKWLVEWNFPGAELPQVWRKCEDEEDLNTTAERDERVSKLGFKPTLKYLHDTYGGEWVEAAQGSAPTGAAGFPGKPLAEAQFAEGEAQFADQIALDAAIEAIAPDALQGQAVAALKPVLKMIATSADYAEVFDQLAATFPSMNDQQLEETLARAMFVAEVWGRLSVAGELRA
jgi:phage gp29-like protein